MPEINISPIQNARISATIKDGKISVDTCLTPSLMAFVEGDYIGLLPKEAVDSVFNTF